MFDDTALEAWESQRPRRERLGPSDVDRCIRQAGYRQMQVPPTDVRSRATARYGSLLHLGYAEIVRSRGLSAEVEIDIPGLGYGHADEVDWQNRRVTDLKSVGGRAYERHITYGLPDRMWDQVELYAYGLLNEEQAEVVNVEREPLPPWTLAVVLFNRETGDETVFMRDADYDHGKTLAWVLGRRQQKIDLATKPEDLPREGAGPGRGFPCDYCDWLSACWPQPENADLSPQSATIAEDPEAVAAVLEDYLEASALASKLENAKKDARAFLQGIPPGEYGAAALKWQGGNDLDPQPDVEEMMWILEERGIPVPMKPRQSATSIRVVRVKPKPVTVEEAPSPEEG